MDDFILKTVIFIMRDTTNKPIVVSHFQGFKDDNEALNFSEFLKEQFIQENPYPIIRQSDSFVLSSKYEGLPNVILEAASLKKFIISSDCMTGPKEILNEGKGGLLFKVGNHEQLADCIIYFKNNKYKLKQKIYYNYKNLKRFDLQKNLKKYYLIINKNLTYS